MDTPRAALATVLLLAVPLSGCVGFGPPETTCPAQHPYADRLVFHQADLYEAMGEARAEANASASASFDRQAQTDPVGTRGVTETVRLDGRVHGTFDAAPDGSLGLRVQDSALAHYGALWLQEVTWTPNGTADERINYTAPADPGDPHRFAMTFETSNTSEAEAADRVRSLHDALFPEDGYDPLEDEDFSRAWLGTYERQPTGPVHADGFLTSLIDAGTLQHRQAPFDDLAFPHALGIVHLQGEDVGPYEGQLDLRLAHDVRAIAVGTDPTLVLEVTPGDRAFVSNLGSAVLGAEELRQDARDSFDGIQGLPSLALAQAAYEEGGQASAQALEACTPMAALGQPLTAGPAE